MCWSSSRRMVRAGRTGSMQPSGRQPARTEATKPEQEVRPWPAGASVRRTTAMSGRLSTADPGVSSDGAAARLLASRDGSGDGSGPCSGAGLPRQRIDTGGYAETRSARRGWLSDERGECQAVGTWPCGLTMSRSGAAASQHPRAAAEPHGGDRGTSPQGGVRRCT